MLDARGYTISASTRLVTESCYSCGVVFAMPEDLRRELLDNHARSFYCPNGHGQHYTGKTAAQKQRERAERLEQQLASRAEDLRVQRAETETARRKLAATKGQLTKTRRRAANGVCPCCNRSFVNVARHVSSQHPEFDPASET